MECFDADGLIRFWKDRSAYNEGGPSNKGKFFKIPTTTLGTLYIDQLDKQKVVKQLTKVRQWKLTPSRKELMGKERTQVVGASHSIEQIYRISPL